MRAFAPQQQAGDCLIVEAAAAVAVVRAEAVLALEDSQALSG